MKYQYLSLSFNEHCWKRNKMKITRYNIKEMILGGKNIFVSLCRKCKSELMWSTQIVTDVFTSAVLAFEDLVLTLLVWKSVYEN